MADETLLVLATDIISAHVSHNKVASDSLPDLISAVYGSLAGLGKPPAPAAEARTPAVSIRASVKPDAITCLECGKKFKTLRRHLGTDHQLTPDEYRKRWNLASDYPIVAPDYAETRKQLAVKIGLGNKPNNRSGRTAGQPAANAAEDVSVTTEAPAATKPAARSRKKLGIAAGA
ncbi:MucR family transcriptional regulator [Novosphingobium sp. PhB55]|uniref:MucR family transcriptional regulator n=1 Tax=Novosphingobium sp. PhB55 TaxID=2485106 RepID=UPI0010652EA3|nr:MucR family transcriptional regulator [Novosphingobium sp. PhB55]TDW61565.1 MucR family transcriptional regulator [Novosphingobium sp. PhB55]